MNPLDYAGLAGFPVVVAIVQVLKLYVFTTVTPSWVITLVTLLVAEAWGIGVAIAACASIDIAVLTGIIVWLMSMGAWSGGKALLNK